MPKRCQRGESDDANAFLEKKKTKTAEMEDQEWEKLYGAEGAKVIRETVEANVKDYEYLKSFAIKV